MNFKRLQTLYKKNNSKILPIKSGMFLELHERVGEGSNQRIWRFKCLVIKVKSPQHPSGTFTVRGEAAGMTIEKVYPLSFPNFEKVILLDEYKVRRSKIYYIREKIGKDARMKSIIDSKDRNKDLLGEVEEVKEDVSSGADAKDPSKEVAKEEVKIDSETSSEGQDTGSAGQGEAEKIEEVKEPKEEVKDENKE